MQGDAEQRDYDSFFLNHLQSVTLTPHRQKEARQRIAAGETQHSVARSYNVSQSTISRL